MKRVIELASWNLIEIIQVKLVAHRKHSIMVYSAPDDGYVLSHRFFWRMGQWLLLVVSWGYFWSSNKLIAWNVFWVGTKAGQVQEVMVILFKGYLAPCRLQMMLAQRSQHCYWGPALPCHQSHLAPLPSLETLGNYWITWCPAASRPDNTDCKQSPGGQAELD